MQNRWEEARALRVSGWLIVLAMILLVGVGLAFAILSVQEPKTVTGVRNVYTQQTAPGNPGTQLDAGAPPAGGTGEAANGAGIGPSQVLGWLGVALALWVGYRVYRLYVITDRNTQIVFADLGNSSGIAALDATMPGLSLLARQEVFRRMERLGRRVEAASESDPGRPRGKAFLLQATLPRSALDTKVTDVAKAIAEGIPEGAKPAAQLLSLLIAARGTMVSGRLQMGGDLPGRAGISLEVADIEGLKEPRSDTFWEPLQRQTGEGTAANGAPQPQGASEENLPAANPPGDGNGGGRTENSGAEEAAALRSLGSLYERRGALEQARTLYEEAATKDPRDESARVSLLQVLSKPNRTPSERYRTLLDPVCRWLATELARDKLLSGLPQQPGDDGRSTRAEVHNFLGSYHAYGDPTYGAFLRAAEREFRLSIEEDPSWYLPRANLGTVLRYEGNYREAIASYDEALRLLRGTQPSEVLPSAQQRIALSKSMAQLLSGAPALRQEGVGTVRDVRQYVDGLADANVRLIYVLACSYAVLTRVASEVGVAAELGVDVDRTRAEARRLRDVALTRDRTGDLRDWSAKDPDLAGIPETQPNQSGSKPNTG